MDLTGKSVDAEHLERRLEVLDQRLDNIDSVVTALVERVMRQPIIIEVPCPKCGSIVQISVTGSVKLSNRASV